MQILEEDFLMFVDRALDGMLRIVEELGDERSNTVPDLPGANSPYAILFHCVAVIDFWVGTLLAGRPVERHRDAEFIAQGTVAEIRRRVNKLKRQLRSDVTHVQGDQPVSMALSSEYNPAPQNQNWTQGATLMHAYEELAQHHG